MLRTVVQRAVTGTSRAWWHMEAAALRPMSRSLGSTTTSVEKPAPPGNGPNHRSIMSLDGNSIRPYVQPDAFVAPSASVIGSVIINDRAFIMYGAVVRGDLALVHIGVHSIIGENCVLTAGDVSDGLSPSDAIAAGLPIEPELSIGDVCNIGANARLHSCILEGYNDVGHGSSIGKGARLGRFAQLRPNSWLPDGTQVPESEIWAGSPATKIGVVKGEDNIPRRDAVVELYKTTYAHSYEFLPVGTVYWEKESLKNESS